MANIPVTAKYVSCYKIVFNHCSANSLTNPSFLFIYVKQDSDVEKKRADDHGSERFETEANVLNEYGKRKRQSDEQDSKNKRHQGLPRWLAMHFPENLSSLVKKSERVSGSSNDQEDAGPNVSDELLALEDGEADEGDINIVEENAGGIQENPVEEDASAHAADYSQLYDGFDANDQNMIESDSQDDEDDEDDDDDFDSYRAKLGSEFEAGNHGEPLVIDIRADIIIGREEYAPTLVEDIILPDQQAKGYSKRKGWCWPR